MNHPPMKMHALPRGARRRIVSICMAVVILSLTGCKGFFIPECQEDNDCTSTTTTGTTATTGTTSTTGTTGTTSTTATTGTTGTTGATGTTGTTSTTATTGTTGTTGTTSTTATTGTTGTTGTTSTTATTGTTSTTGSPITPSDSNHSVVYVASANAGTITAYSTSSGQVASARQPVAAPAPPMAIAATPNENFLYLATSDGSIYLNTIASDGSLQPGNGGNPVANTTQPTWMSMDRTGKWLFVTSVSTPSVQEFRIDAATGALHPVAQTPLLDAGKPGEVYVTPDNQEVFVALGKGGVDAFRFNVATGVLGTRQHIAPLHAEISADNALTSDSGSKNLYVGEANAGIRVFAIGSAGTLQEIAGSPFGSLQTTPTSLIVDPSNDNLFVADSSANTITGYTITADGALAASSSTTFPADASPASLTLDGSGKYLLSISKSAVPKLSILPSK